MGAPLRRKEEPDVRRLGHEAEARAVRPRDPRGEGAAAGTDHDGVPAAHDYWGLARLAGGSTTGAMAEVAVGETALSSNESRMDAIVVRA